MDTSAPKRTVGFGIVGGQLDGGDDEDRWQRWRPTVGLCQQPDLVLDRLELFHQRATAALAKRVAADIRKVSPETEVVLRRMEFRDPWDFAEVFEQLHGFAREYAFDPDAEDYLVHLTTGTHVWQVCLFLLTESHHIPARLVQTSPPRRSNRRAAADGAGRVTVIDLDLSRYDRLAERFAAERREGVSFLKAGIETESEAFNVLIERIEQVALHSTGPLLLSGATGAGKTQLARRIFELRRRQRLVGEAFVEVNCATLRGDAAMSALFGHVKGAFTGANADREGYLRAADGGLLFLDEVGELGLDEQAMLLRAIEEGTFLPLGADRPASSSFQLIAGTNRDLDERVREGAFRDDLLARIDLWSFRLPALRERLEDLEPNLEFELERVARDTGRRVTFTREARRAYLDFARGPAAAWRGNFRDLAASITRLATLAAGGRIGVELVAEETARLARQWAARAGGAERAAADDPVERVLGPDAAAALDRFDRVQLAEVLRVCALSPSLSAAGRTLFASSIARRRSKNDADRLSKYLARFGLRWAQVGPARSALDR